MFYTNLDKFKSENGYEIDGIWYPRVTSIVSIKAKPALYKFYAELESFEHGESIKEKSAQEGTLLHETVEAILSGGDPLVPDSIEGAIGAFMDFKSQNNIIAHQIESRVVSFKHRYAGTIDVLAEINGKLGVLDIKTSVAIYRDYGLQAAAYVEALSEKLSMPPLTRWILRLDQSRSCLRGCGAKMRDKGGRKKVRNKNGENGCPHVWGKLTGEFELKELKSFDADLRAFLASKSLWEWENDYWLSKIV